MNNLMLLVVLFVMFIYFGGSNVPLVLKQNKEMLLGVAGGLVLCSFFGMKLEGLGGFGEACVNNNDCTSNNCVGSGNDRRCAAQTEADAAAAPHTLPHPRDCSPWEVLDPERHAEVLAFGPVSCGGTMKDERWCKFFPQECTNPSSGDGR